MKNLLFIDPQPTHHTTHPVPISTPNPETSSQNAPDTHTPPDYYANTTDDKPPRPTTAPPPKFPWKSCPASTTAPAPSSSRSPPAPSALASDRRWRCGIGYRSPCLGGSWWWGRAFCRKIRGGWCMREWKGRRSFGGIRHLYNNVY